MKTTLKSPESADYRRGLGIFLTETPPTYAPKHLFLPLSPVTPISLHSGPTQWLFQGPPAESKFLAALALEGVGWFARCLDQWAAAVAKRLIEYRELAAACNARLQAELENGVHVLPLDDRQRPVRPLPVLMAAGNGRMQKAGYFASDHSHIIAHGATAAR